MKIVSAYLDAQPEKNRYQNVTNPHDDADENVTGQTRSGTSFLTVDQNGLAVACNLSLHKSFGTGGIIPELGFALAHAPKLNDVNLGEADSKGFYPSLPAPFMIIRGAIKNHFFYAVASGARFRLLRN